MVSDILTHLLVSLIPNVKIIIVMIINVQFAIRFNLVIYKNPLGVTTALGVAMRLFNFKKGNNIMAIVDIVQRTEKWFEWRKEGITASMIPIILGLSPYQTPYELWAELVGLKEPADLSNNWHVQRGIDQEPEARSTIERELGKPFIPVCVEADHNIRFKSSLDGLFVLNNISEVLEIKCPCEKIYRSICEFKGASENFQMYAAQVQWQLNCSNSEKGILYFYLRGERPIKVTIKRNQAFIDKAEKAALLFWEQVQTKTPPNKMDGRDTVSYEFQQKDANWDANVTEYKKIDKEIKLLESKIAELKSRSESIEDYFKQQIPTDSKSFDKDGIRATKCERKGKVDKDAFLAAISNKTGILQSELTEIEEANRLDGSTYFRISTSTNSNVQIEPGTKVPENNSKRTDDTVAEIPKKPLEEIATPMPPADFFKSKAVTSLHF
ncbi:lambda-exonuclease family protein [Psychromonas sp. KJ10-2]|uniref:lambda-exonuclease family protein n=1 Tax=Psychromonas sp. KJ10-2 TaxID=3391822 RepID=UPI0039B4E15F